MDGLGMENPIKIHDLEVSLFFWKHPYRKQKKLWGIA